MKKMIVLLCVVAFVASSAAFVVASDDVLTLEGGKMGTVTFDHGVHKAKVGADKDEAKCLDCHHKGVEEDTAKMKCTSCHGVDAAAPKAKKAFHDQCKGCHKEQAGPTKCKGCHVK